MAQKPQLCVFRLLHKTNSKSAKSCCCPVQVFVQHKCILKWFYLLTGQLKSWALQCDCFEIIPLAAVPLPLGILQSDKRLAWVHQNLGFVGAGWTRCGDWLGRMPVAHSVFDKGILIAEEFLTGWIGSKTNSCSDGPVPCCGSGAFWYHSQRKSFPIPWECVFQYVNE